MGGGSESLPTLCSYISVFTVVLLPDPQHLTKQFSIYFVKFGGFGVFLLLLFCLFVCCMVLGGEHQVLE